MTANVLAIPRPVVAARLLLALNAAIWVVLGVLGLARGESLSSVMLIVYILALADAAVLLWLSWRISRPQRWSYYLALLVLAANAVLSITDEFGLSDLAVLCLNLVTLALLVAGRAYFTPRRERQPS
jgi:hypothetical protein